MKCTINENNEITNFWEDEHAPGGTIDCDKVGRPLGEGAPGTELDYFWKLEDGKVLSTTSGAEFIAQEYARNRKSEYPTVAELTVALYDTDDKAAIDTKRAAVKTKWPKDNSGPV